LPKLQSLPATANWPSPCTLPRPLANLQLRCADALARRGKIDEARKLLAERLREHPGQSDIIRALALIDLMAGQPAHAIAELDEILATNPGDVRALVDKAVALDLQGQHTAAQVIYRQVLAMVPNDVAATNNLALSLMLEGRTRQALEVLAPMQGSTESPQRLKVNLGILYAATGNAEQSRQLLRNRVADSDVSALARAVAEHIAITVTHPIVADVRQAAKLNQSRREAPPKLRYGGSFSNQLVRRTAANSQGWNWS
jgi:Flp pilus assembly protein TadD